MRVIRRGAVVHKMVRRAAQSIRCNLSHTDDDMSRRSMTPKEYMGHGLMGELMGRLSGGSAGRSQAARAAAE